MIPALLFILAIEPRLAPTVKPTHYDMTLTVDPSQSRFSGRETIAVNLSELTREIHLHAVGLAIEELIVEHAGKAIAAAHRSSGQELIITPAEPLLSGEVLLHLSWSGPLDGNKLRGLYRFQSSGVWYVGSTFEATDARRMAPCFDEPAFKAPLTLTLRVPKALIAVSNAPVASESKDKDTREVRFAPTAALSTYLWAVMVGPFTVTDGGRFGHTPVRIITTEDKAPLAAGTAKIVREAGAELEKYFDSHFPFAKLDIVALPEFGSGAMENAGAIAGREERLLLPLSGGSRDEKRDVSMVITHEMAHQWFGDLVTMAWWDDLWLNESFAEWLGISIADRLAPELGTRFLLARGKRRGMAADALPSSHAVRVAVASADEARAGFDVITYQKGAAILAMLQSWLGADAFRDGLRRYIRNHAGGNATSADLFAALADASGKDVAAVATGWLTHPGFPMLVGRIDCQGKPTLQLTQKPYALLGQKPPATPWQVPICARDAAGTACGIVGQAPLALPLSGDKCPQWIAPNASGVGFFAYALQENAAVARGAAQLFPEERFDFLINQWALVQSGEQSAQAFMLALAPLASERHPLPLEAMADVLLDLRDALVSEPTQPAFARLAAAYFSAQARALGWQTKAGEDDLAQEARRYALRGMGLVAEDPETIAAATALAHDWLRDPSQVPADVSQTALEIFARHATVADIAVMAAALADKSDPQRHSRITGVLGLSHDAAAQQAGLALLLGGHDVRAQDVPVALYFISNDAVAARGAWPWLQAHFSDITKDMPPLSAAALPLVTHTFCTPEAHTEVAQFFAAHPLPLKPRLGEALAHIDACVALRASQSAGFARALEKKTK
jgi:alanyl aminopeptidase